VTTTSRERRLVFLPGAGGSPQFWRPLGNLLPNEWSKVYLGWPGIGEQPADPTVSSFADLVTLVERQLSEEPSDLLGNSMGGVVALHVALRNPGKVRRLVLAVTSGGVDVMKRVAYDWRPAQRAKFPTGAAWLADYDIDLTTEMPRVTMPALLLWGGRDPISPVMVGERLQQLLPNARLHVVTDGDHDIVQTHARELSEMVIDHLA
jgi:pimeloyl-ACP methyl ester carboxylesterase